MHCFFFLFYVFSLSSLPDYPVLLEIDRGNRSFLLVFFSLSFRVELESFLPRRDAFYYFGQQPTIYWYVNSLIVLG